MNIQELAMLFLVFWQKHFPEQGTISREEALSRCEDAKRGYLGKQEPKKMKATELHAGQKSYQDLVSSVYGAYELAEYHMETFLRVLENITLPVGNLLSLGCGPASIELFLLTQGLIDTATLVDISPAMLERARGIAEEYGAEEKIEVVCSPVFEYVPRENNFDIAWSVNAAHWDPRWINWIIALRKGVRPNGQLFFSATMSLPTTKLSEKGVKKFLATQMRVTNEGDVIPQIKLPDGRFVKSFRHFWAGTPKK